MHEPLAARVDAWRADGYVHGRYLRRAIEEPQDYLVRKMAEVRETERLQRRTDLNHGQVALLSNALRHADTPCTVHSHVQSHRVTRQLARTDPADLEARGYLERRIIGRRFEWLAAPDLRDGRSCASA